MSTTPLLTPVKTRLNGPFRDGRRGSTDGPRSPEEYSEDSFSKRRLETHHIVTVFSSQCGGRQRYQKTTTKSALTGELAFRLAYALQHQLCNGLIAGYPAGLQASLHKEARGVTENLMLLHEEFGNSTY
jgi:hypothetical protein